VDVAIDDGEWDEAEPPAGEMSLYNAPEGEGEDSAGDACPGGVGLAVWAE